MKNKTKYYLKYEGEEVTIMRTFRMNGIEWCVVDNGDCYSLYKKTELMLYKDTNHFKRKQELTKEIKELEKQRDKKVKEIQDKAIKSLSARIKMNVVFGSNIDGATTSIMLKIVKELEKLIKKDIGN